MQQRFVVRTNNPRNNLHNALLPKALRLSSQVRQMLRKFAVKTNNRLRNNLVKLLSKSQRKRPSQFAGVFLFLRKVYAQNVVSILALAKAWKWMIL
jgi:hypothetical protein